jgi:hypothetical protein
MPRWPQSRTLLRVGLSLILGATVGFLLLIPLGRHFPLGSQSSVVIGPFVIASIAFLTLVGLVGLVMTLTGAISLTLNLSHRNMARAGAALSVASLGLMYRFGGLLFVIFLALWHTHSAPELWIVPQPLSDVSVDRSSGQKFSFLGYELESPWTDFQKETTYKTGGVRLSFSFGEIFAYTDEDLADLKKTTFTSLVSDTMGNAVISSNYAFRSKVLFLTPRDVHFFPSLRTRIAVNEFFMNSKQLLEVGPAGRTGMFTFQTDAIRGFQIGNPAQSTLVEIYAFSKQDREITIGVRQDHGPKSEFTQAKINRVLYSLRPIPTRPD